MANSLKKHGYRPSAEAIFDNLTKDFSNFVGEYFFNDIQISDIISHITRNFITYR